MPVLSLKDKIKNEWVSIPAIKGEKGEAGTGFLIERTYTSEADLLADTNPVTDGSMVAVIETSDTKVYIRSSSTVVNTTIGDLSGYKFFVNLNDIKVIKGERGEKGDNGYTPYVTEDKNNTNNIYKLNIENSDGIFTTPNLQGQSGDGSGDMLKSIYDPNNKGYDIYAHDIKDDTVTFTKANNRENIASGETIDNIMGKLSKLIDDLKTVSFSGNLTDLNGTISDLSGTLPLTKGGTGATTAKNARTNLGITNLTIISNTAPTDTTSLWLDTSLAKPALKYYNGSAWVKVTSDGGIYRGTTQPTDTDMLWINTSTGVTKYYNGSAWVNVASTWG